MFESLRQDWVVLSADQAASELAAATRHLLADIEGLCDRDIARASLLPGWTRGHVLAHLARNAEGGVRLLTWARTGVPSYEYPSLSAREDAIAAGAMRPAASLINDVQVTAARFAAAAAAVPTEAWQRVVRYTAGSSQKAAVIVPARLTEVLIHHVDLDLEYEPRDWPGWFTRRQLDKVTALLTSRNELSTPFRLRATDTDREFEVRGVAPPKMVISGPESGLVAWLYGRSNGTGLTVEPPGRLPEIPKIY